jgi:hypothetical protein
MMYSIIMTNDVAVTKKYPVPLSINNGGLRRK